MKRRLSGKLAVALLVLLSLAGAVATAGSAGPALATTAGTAAPAAGLPSAVSSAADWPGSTWSRRLQLETC
jgi:hypothetical protein